MVGAQQATDLLADGSQVTVSCAEGDVGKVYQGDVPFEIIDLDLSESLQTTTEIMVNLGKPDLAFQTSMFPSAGVGLARMEFIISESIRAHPMAVLFPERLPDPGQRDVIRKMIDS